VAGFREVQASSDLKVGRNLTVSALAVWQAYDGGPAMPAARVWLARIRSLYHFNNNRTYVRGIWQWESDTRRREFSVLAAHVVNYGTQVHVGFESRSSATGGSVDDLMGRRVVFVRISYLLRR
jgi:hypothetical protein